MITCTVSVNVCVSSSSKCTKTVGNPLSCEPPRLGKYTCSLYLCGRGMQGVYMYPIPLISKTIGYDYLATWNVLNRHRPNVTVANYIRCDGIIN